MKQVTHSPKGREAPALSRPDPSEGSLSLEGLALVRWDLSLGSATQWPPGHRLALRLATKEQ